MGKIEQANTIEQVNIPATDSKQVVDANKAPELKPLEWKIPQLSVGTKKINIDTAINDLKNLLTKGPKEKNELANTTINDLETQKAIEIFDYVSRNLDKLPPDKLKTYAEIKEKSRELYNEVKPEALTT